MALKAPAGAAALISQTQALGPDLAPFIGSGDSRQPSASAEPSPEPEPVLPLGHSQELVPADRTPAPSWKELLTGQDHSRRRLASFFLAALALSTLVRSACFSQWAFGPYLLENLAPVERDTVRWKYIVANRAWEIALGAWVWRRLSGVVRGEGALFGVLLALVARLSLYVFEHSYFLLSTQTVAVLLLIDAISFASAFSLAPSLLPHAPSARPVLTALTRLRTDHALWVNVLLGVGLATFGGAAGSYVLERAGGRAFVERNTIEATVPSYLLKDQLSTSEILSHPSWTIPTLRTYDFPPSMASHLLHSLLTSLSLLPLLLSLPSLSPLSLAALAAAAVGIPAVGVFYDVLPVSLPAALGTGAALAARAAWAAAAQAWAMDELRRVKVTRKVKVVLVEPESGEVIATSEALVEEDARGVLRKDAQGVTRRRMMVRGEVEY
ncbi:hypothetical protein JCM10449v2_008214 [Rhodotorula kratochvilovae]